MPRRVPLGIEEKVEETAVALLKRANIHIPNDVRDALDNASV